VYVYLTLLHYIRRKEEEKDKKINPTGTSVIERLYIA
jgi:hypothetical protein